MIRMGLVRVRPESGQGQDRVREKSGKSQGRIRQESGKNNEKKKKNILETGSRSCHVQPPVSLIQFTNKSDYCKK